MQFQRALTVGKLLLGHNLVNLCSLRILPYLTQPDTVTQECSPSLWPLVRRSPRVSGHSGEAAPASLRPRRASRAVLTRRLGRRGARGHAVLRPRGARAAVPEVPPAGRFQTAEPPFGPGHRGGRRVLRDGAASAHRFSARLSPGRSVAGFHPEGAPRPPRHRHLWVPPQGPGPAGSLRRWLEALSGPAGRSRRSACQGRREAPRACAEGPGRAAVSPRGRELGPAVGRSRSRTQGRGSWPGRRPGKAAAGCVC